MPTEIHTWRCDKCHRSYPTRERAVECEETCTQPVRRDTEFEKHYLNRPFPSERRPS